MMSTDSLAFTEFEEGIAFDDDDPDFATPATNNNNNNGSNKACSLEAMGPYTILYDNMKTYGGKHAEFNIMIRLLNMCFEVRTVVEVEYNGNPCLQAVSIRLFHI
ncbi:hypothetical protein C0J52_26102 [Blattella germanica]|nr:hypothetical protein C0J52_26102 [Blattella germanica]